MNKVQLIIAELSDEQLRKGVQDLHTLDTTGVLPPDSEVRKLALRLVDEVGMTGHDARSVAHSSMIREAAFKWAGVK